MQSYWNRFAFVRLTLWLAIGIVVGTFVSSLYSIFLLLFILSIVSYFALTAFRNRYFKTQQSLQLGVLAFVMSCSVGYLNAYFQSEKNSQQHLLNHNYEQLTAFKANLISKAKETEKTQSFKVQINAVKLDSVWMALHSKAIIYLQKGGKTDSLFYGDELLINSSLSVLEGPKNPLEFNYKRFLGFSQVYFQQYVPLDNYTILKEENGNPFTAASIRTSTYLSNLLGRYINDPQSLAIAKALTIGVKDELDDDIKTAYASAGAMHVLAVSGLHVGIIFLIISTLFKPWKHRQKGRFVFAVVSIIGLWTYAFITGLSPSVLRAATMFSFIIVGQTFKRHTNIYNTLAASAFVLLLFNPFLLFSVGFQLSYLAVFGIVFFQPKIYQLLAVRNSLLDKIWAITAVSIAAQLATAPLGILYFHQFPTYFFISNLVVIPAAFLILNGSILLLAFSWWEWLAKLIGSIIDLLIWAVNQLIFMFERFPASTIEGIYMTTFETWMIYLILVFFALFIVAQKLTYWKYAFITIFLCSFLITNRHLKRASENRFTVYDTKGDKAFALRNGFSQYIKLDTALIEDKSKLRFHVYPSQLQAGIADFHPDDFNPKNQQQIFSDWNGISVTVWNDLVIGVISGEVSQNFQLNEKAKIDYLIMSENRGSKCDLVFDQFEIGYVIIDASNNYYEIQRLKNILEEKQINYYVVPEEGAFELKI